GCSRVFGLGVSALRSGHHEIRGRGPIVQAASRAGIVIGLAPPGDRTLRHDRDRGALLAVSVRPQAASGLTLMCAGLNAAPWWSMAHSLRASLLARATAESPRLLRRPFRLSHAAVS